ncbi:MAG: Asp-tRNA(Asn)/Glu-tRNA(Gln) amidotransferase subunit GatA [Pirellulaceae bacterium]
MKLEVLPAVTLASMIAARELTSREATEYFLSRIRRLDTNVGAFISVDEEAALRRADEVDARLVAGEFSNSPLAGVPIAIKDILCMTGSATTCASRMLEDFRPPYTATAVQKLLDAGMVPLGKTNLDEFAMGGSTESSALRRTCNPWDPERTPGGSSGGAAAALSAGLTPLAIGTDTGGSVRQPAAFCGTLGLKPTYGRVSRYGLIAFASSLDQVGPLAHHVQDLAACLNLIAGHDRLDSTSLDVPVPDYASELAQPLAGLRVGLIREQIDNDSIDAAIRDATLRCQQTLSGLGAELIDVHLPHTQYSVPTYYLIAPSEASGNLERYDGVHYGKRSYGDAGSPSPLEAMIARSRSEGFGPEVKRRIMLGTFALSAGYYDAYYKKALQVRRLIANDYQQAFTQVDVLLGPVTPTPAFKLGEKSGDPVQMYLEDLFTVGANLAGIPGLSVPAGCNAQGLPLAVQFQAPALAEAKLLNVAHQLQQAEFFKPALAPSFAH